MAFVRVAFPVPLRQTFLYSVPDELVSAALPGVAVRCPFGPRERRGIVVERAETADRAGVKPIASVSGDGRVFAPDLLRLCLWIADYYLAPIGRVLQGALPGGLLGFEKSRARKGARDGDGAVHDADCAARVALTPAQVAAAQALKDALGASAFAAFLLHGVTGSGKTEVYLEAAETCRRARRQTLVLVPEIALAGQIVRAFRTRFGDRVGVLHSSLTVGERRATWERARAGQLDAVVGARSAVFAPMPALGLVVVDEEHDPAYKQSEHIRYHGRDTAVVRARLANALVVLGSATPSLESFANAERGKYRLLALPERVDRRPMPVVEIVDLNERKGEGAPKAGAAATGDAPKPGKPRVAPGLFTAPLLDGLAGALERKDQALVFLNRRGHTRVVECEDCGFVARCPSCDVSLTYHSSDETFRCHYCGRRETAAGACPRCASPFFRHRGAGTQKAEKELQRHFPEARIVRMDSDSAAPRGAHAAILGAFARGEADILLGTQMIAKGLDFHRVTFVGVVSADHSLHLPDFRAAERTFQQLVQVAGRAGRGSKAGRVVVQTRAPEHPALVFAAQHDFAGFARAELAMRNEFGYPPFGRLVALALSGPDEERVVEAAMRVVEAVGEAKAGFEAAARTRGLTPEGALDVLGPAPSPLARLRGRHRWRITLKDRDLKRLHAVTRAALDGLEGGRGKIPAGVLLSVDMDPYDVL